MMPTRHDWIGWLRERDAQVLLLTLVQAVEDPTTSVHVLRQMVAGWRTNAHQALAADNWQARVDGYLEVWVDAAGAGDAVKTQ
jgi:hypothetical protein